MCVSILLCRFPRDCACVSEEVVSAGVTVTVDGGIAIFVNDGYCLRPSPPAGVVDGDTPHSALCALIGEEVVTAGVTVTVDGGIAVVVYDGCCL